MRTRSVSTCYRAPDPLFRFMVGRSDQILRQGNIGDQVAVNSDTVPDDETLVERIAGGDERAFNAVVRAHSGRIRALALGFSGGMAEADDVVQETFWSLWRNAGKWKPGGPPLAAYLNRIALNRAIDRDRRRKVRRFFGLEEAGEPADPSPQQSQHQEARSELAAVMGDVRELPARQRAAILLAADGELTNAEIGESMGLSVGAAEQLLVRARRTLRARLAVRNG